jgi:hypothetical protein
MTNTILGFPFIIPMKLAMVLHKGYIHSEILKEEFPSTMKSAHKDRNTTKGDRHRNTNTPPSQ